MDLLKSLILIAFTCDSIINGLDDFGGHSREFQSIDEPIDWNLISGKHLTKRSVKINPTIPSDQEISEFIYSHKDAKNILIENMQQILNDSWVFMTVRIKSFNSVKEKIIRKNDTLKRIRDTIGLRLTLQTVSDAIKIKKFLNNTSTHKKFQIHEIRCYGICDSDMKYTHSGYRRIHLLVKINGFNKWAEIQIGTPYCNVWADWSHDFLYKGIFANQNETESHNYAFKLADYFYNLDQIRDQMVSCPDRLAHANAKDELSPDAYIELYGPKSLCFYWTDIFMVKPQLINSTVDSLPTPSPYYDETEDPYVFAGNAKMNPLNVLIFIILFLTV